MSEMLSPADMATSTDEVPRLSESQPEPLPTRRRPTIADVARRAGVSSAAVSFAINDRPGVSPETRERILEVARELGWRPSASARALTEARTRAIGFVLARDPAQIELDSFFVRFLSGLERTLSPADYALLLQLVPEGPALSAYERLAYAGRVDGFLLADVEVDDPRFALLQDAGLPVVLAGHPVGDCPFPWVETRHADLVVVPGWRGIDEAVPGELIRELQDACARGTRLMSLCSGIVVLAAAGVLDERRATTHWRYIDRCAWASR